MTFSKIENEALFKLGEIITGAMLLKVAIPIETGEFRLARVRKAAETS